MALETSTIHQGDCIAHMNEMQAGSVDLVFADPPFNIGYDYDVYDDKLGYEQYLGWSGQWIRAVHRVLQPHGTFWLAIGDEYAAELKIESQKAGFICRSWVIWYYTFGVNCAKKFTRSHAHLFHFVKDRDVFTFRDDDLENRVPSARELIYNDRRANPDGRLPDDTWIVPPADAQGTLSPDEPERFLPTDLPLPDDSDQTFTLRPQDVAGGFSAKQDTWHFSRVAGTFKERAGFHGCQMPEQLLGRIIRTCSYPGELVLDPFSGSATTLAVAKKLGRQFIGFDLSEDYVRFGRERLADIQVGDPLNGAPEPTKKALNERREKADAAKRGGKSKPQRAARQPAFAVASQPLFADLETVELDPEPNVEAEEAEEAADAAAAQGIDVAGLLEAFQETHDGFSADRVVADPALSEAFAAACQRRSLEGNRKAWNIALFRLRKAGKLAGIATSRRTEIAHEATDRFLYASEIALQEMLVSNAATSLDEILCDPELADQFDLRSQRLAGAVPAFDLRWAALQLRKTAKTARVRGEQLMPPKPSAWSDPLELHSVDLDAIPETSGLYLLLDASDAAVYVGESLNLRARFQLQFREDARPEWQQIAPGLTVRLFPTELTEAGPLASQSCVAQQFQPRLNYRELYAESPSSLRK